MCFLSCFGRRNTKPTLPISSPDREARARSVHLAPDQLQPKKDPFDFAKGNGITSVHPASSSISVACSELDFASRGYGTASPEPSQYSSAKSDTAAYSAFPPLQAHLLGEAQSKNTLPPYTAPSSQPEQPQPTALTTTTTLLPGPTTPPRCLDCGLPTIRHMTSRENANNGGRPYYKCSCGKWATFGDKIGNHPWNPPCACGLSSRRQKKNGKNVYFYRCRMGACKFFSNETWEEAQEQRRRADLVLSQGMANLAL